MKVVAGFTLQAMKSQVIAVAIKSNEHPVVVDGWEKWFKGQSCDHHAESGERKQKLCGECKKGPQCEGKQCV
ncbi:hypothetical protein G6162_001533 [Salmonella enterica]|nr:hypothetical protein [Salmonella enterica]EAT8889926.1 hypothetical protein [Salmonella enterica subsp. arizonae serovar 53:z4,z23,z32:-]EDO6343568.1 hypothetical protein [Salmonella enterica subsp. houtenae serovar 48:g,z51:-]EAN0851410.1 hypothetical protein [Salmonella enterica]EAO9786617.1 hypothetical protein [Salmonella enterica]